MTTVSHALIAAAVGTAAKAPKRLVLAAALGGGVPDLPLALLTGGTQHTEGPRSGGSRSRWACCWPPTLAGRRGGPSSARLRSRALIATITVLADISTAWFWSTFR